MWNGKLYRLEKEDLQRFVYHVMPIKWFKKVLRNRQMLFAKPHCWNDPFDNFFLSIKLKEQNGMEHDLGHLGNSMYAQCWTTNQESESMWTTRPEPCIKVKAKLSDVFQALRQSVIPAERPRCYVGRVQYLRKSEILARLTPNMLRKLGKSYRTCAQTLFWKTKQFSFEKEIRLVYASVLDYADRDRFPVAINPTEFFQEVTIDPRISFEEFRKYKKQLIGLGYDGKTTRSGLYTWNKSIIHRYSQLRFVGASDLIERQKQPFVK